MMNHSGSLVWKRVNSATKPQINACLNLCLKKIKNTVAIHTHGSCDHKSNNSIWAASQSPVVLSNSGSGKVMAVEIPGLCLACAQTKLQTKRDIIQMLSPALCFWLFSSFLHPIFSSPLDLFLSEICMRACAEQTWGVNSRNQRKPSVRNKRWICLLLSIFCFIPPPRLSLWTSWAWQSLRFKNTKNFMAEVHLNWRQTHRNRLRL